MSNRLLGRREFTLESVLAILATATIAITDSGCSSYGDSPTGSPTGPSEPAGDGDKVGTVSANHGHRAVVTSAQLTAGDGVSINIRGSATHPHTLTLTAAEIASIASSQRVSKDSSNDDDHTHTVTFN